MSDDVLKLTVKPTFVCFLFSVYVMATAALPCTSNRLLDWCLSRFTEASNPK